LLAAFPGGDAGGIVVGGAGRGHRQVRAIKASRDPASPAPAWHAGAARRRQRGGRSRARGPGAPTPATLRLAPGWSRSSLEKRRNGSVPNRPPPPGATRAHNRSPPRWNFTDLRRTFF
jgi:hypothetical protein